MVTNYDFETPDEPPEVSQDTENHVLRNTQHEKLQNRREKKILAMNKKIPTLLV